MTIVAKKYSDLASLQRPASHRRLFNNPAVIVRGFVAALLAAATVTIVVLSVTVLVTTPSAPSSYVDTNVEANMMAGERMEWTSSRETDLAYVGGL